MQVPGSGVCVAMALAPGVPFITRCGVGVFGLLEEFGCWSVGVPRLRSVRRSRILRAGVLPVVPMVEFEGRVSLCPDAPVVEVVLLC